MELNKKIVPDAFSGFVNSTNCLRSFKFFPQPVFLLQQDLQLIETNVKGTEAISKNWVSLAANNRLHFNCRENDNYVSEIIMRLTKDADFLQSERFILKSLDQHHRVFTLTLESPHNDSDLILTIHEDFSSK